MADQTQANYEINLKDGASGAAASAAGSLKRLRDAIDRDTKALSDMQRAMKNLQGGSVVNVAQFKELKAKIDAKRASIAQAQSSYIALGGSFGRSSKGGKETAGVFQLLAKNAQSMGGPIGGLVSRFGNLRGLLAGGVIVLGIVAVAAAFVALAAAIVGATAALIKYGFASANARRDELIHLEGLTKLRNWYGIAAGNAGEMQAAIDKVSASSALGRDKIAAYAAQLYKAHLRGENFNLALEAMATKSVAVGEEQAQAFAGMAAAMNMTGGSVKRLADDVKARFGGVAAKAMLSWGVQVAKMRENIDRLFDDLKIEGVLSALNQVTSLFSQSTSTGRALRAIITSLFSPLLGSVEKTGPLVKRFFQGMVIGALYVTIAILTLRNWFKKTFGDSGILKGINGQNLALKAGLLAVSLLTGALTILAIPMALVVLQMSILAGAVYWVYKSFSLVVDAVKAVGRIIIWANTTIIGFIGKAYAAFTSVDWSGLGSAIIDGIVNGLSAGADAVIEAVKDLGSSAASAFKSVLGIASPSKEFTKYGRSIAQGAQQGVEQGTPGLGDSVGKMVNVPAEQGGASPRGGKSLTISFGDIIIQGKSDDPKGMAASLKRELETVLEGVAIQLGAKLNEG